MRLIKSFRKTCIALTLIAFIFMSSISPFSIAKTELLDETQRNAIAMLNYITVLTQEINASKNSRLYMEQAYSSLINNIYPNSVDSRTLSQLTGLLDIMEGYRMVNVKRDRLQHIYMQNQAQAIRAAIPNPLGLLSTTQSFRPSKIAASITYMVVDSVTSYNTYTSEMELQHLKDGWALDDEEAEALHNSRKNIFSYMVNMVNEYKLPGDLILTDSTVNEFVKWKNNENVVGRIHFLESNKKTYQSYGGYWLALSQGYYENGEFRKCLEALDMYESMMARIFRKDYDLVRLLPNAISAADEVLDGDEYINAVSRYAQLILDNTENSDWALRYFAAQSYIDLYGKSQDSSYLRRAYDIVLDNINYLVDEQRGLNAVYLAPVNKAEEPQNATNDEKKQVKDYNKTIIEVRKKELPPVSEPVLLNCELLHALADKMVISENAKKKINDILHPNGDNVFLTLPLDARYWFAGDPKSIYIEDTEVEYGGTAIILPVEYVTEQALITVTVKEMDAGEEVFTDWTIDKVERVNQDEFASFRVVYTSNEAKKHNWGADAEISINIEPKEGIDCTPYRFEYVTHSAKNHWYDYLRFWEGHKNHWYDYAKFWENSVVFERVK